MSYGSAQRKIQGTSHEQKRMSEYVFEVSLAHMILQVTGIIPTENPKLLRAIPENRVLRDLLNVAEDQRNKEWRGQVRQAFRTAAEVIVNLADGIATTCIGARSVKMIRKFVRDCDAVCIDEAASTAEIDCLVGTKGHKAVIQAGDPNQTQPMVFSEREKHKDSDIRVNANAPQTKLSEMQRLMNSAGLTLRWMSNCGWRLECLIQSAGSSTMTALNTASLSISNRLTFRRQDASRMWSARWNQVQLPPLLARSLNPKYHVIFTMSTKSSNC